MEAIIVTAKYWYEQPTLLEDIEAYLKERKVTATAFGKAAINNPAIVGRLRKDPLSISLRTALRLRQYMDKDRSLLSG
jgi:hypothetical protein